MWQYLDQNYGDPRVISVTVTAGIHNSHVISLIECKMTKDDIKVWAHHQHDQKVEPSMESLLKWMEDEMSARLCSGATIRKVRSSVHATV